MAGSRQRLVQHPCQPRQVGADGAHQLHRRAVAAVDLRRQRIDVQQLALTGAVPQHGVVFDGAVADADHQIRILQQLVPGWLLNSPTRPAKSSKWWVSTTPAA